MSREISVYDGQDRIGGLRVRRPGKDGCPRVEAFDAEGASLGIYPDVRSGFAAVSVADRRSGTEKGTGKGIPAPQRLEPRHPSVGRKRRANRAGNNPPSRLKQAGEPRAQASKRTLKGGAR